jgi:hypothetical protein
MEKRGALRGVGLNNFSRYITGLGKSSAEMATSVSKLRNIPRRLSSIAREWKYLTQVTTTSLHRARRIRKALRNEPPLQMQVPKRAIINSGTSWLPLEIELYFAWLLAAAGCRVEVMLDDGMLAHWEAAQVHNLRHYSPYQAPRIVRRAHRVGKVLAGYAYRHPNIRIIPYSAVVPASAVTEESPGWHRSFAESSVKRFFQDGDPEGSLEKEHYYGLCLRNCRISEAVGRYAVEQAKADLFITSHGIYSLWGPAYRVAADSGTPTAVWQTAGTQKGALRIVDVHDGILVRSSAWQTFRRQAPFCPEILDEGKTILDSRINLTALDTNEYFAGLHRNGNTQIPLSIPCDATTFGMFPNVVWDGDIAERNIMFSSVVEWCVFTINAFRQLPHHLIIRFHPSEATRLKGSRPLESVVRQHIPDLDMLPNVHLIKAEYPVNSYALAREFVDIGLIYDGHLCVELAHMGIPVIACTQGNFTDDAFTRKPSSPEQYQDWLASPEEAVQWFESCRDHAQSMAHAFAYWEYRDSVDFYKPLVQPFPPRMDYDSLPAGSPMGSDGARIVRRILGITGV